MEMARLCAAGGDDVVLVARNEGKLHELANELTATHNVDAKVIAADLTDPDAPAAIFKHAPQIDVLFNNAGFGSTGAFLELDLQKELEMVAVNVRALVALTHLFAKPMKERGFGRICNVASTAGFQPGPFMATYYATKAFVISFSEAVAHELKGTGVTVTCHCPSATATGFSGRAGNENTPLFRSGVAKADAVAAHAYRATMRGDGLAIPGAMNWIKMESIRLAPRLPSLMASFTSAAVSPSP